MADEPPLSMSSMNHEPMSNRQVIAWWETRRIYYNAALLFIGIAAIVGFEFVMDKAIPVGEDAIEPMALLVFVPLYALMANVCYTLGWIFELAGRNTDTVYARRRARWMYRRGMLFACLLTSLPFWYSYVFWIFFNERTHLT